MVRLLQTDPVKSNKTTGFYGIPEMLGIGIPYIVASFFI